LSLSETVKRKEKKFVATEGGSRIEFESAGFNDGNWASITVENEQVLTREQASRGINVIVLDGRTHKVIHRKTYDTWGKQDDVKAMIEDSKKTPKGSVVIAVVKDGASRLLTPEAKKFFIKMGSEEIKALGEREGWGFVGVFGTKAKVFGEQRGAKVRATMVLGYSKAVKEKVKKPAKVEGGSRFEVHSAGKTVGNFAKIMVNNEVVPTCKDDKGCRGLNVVATDPFTHKIILTKSYDTFGNGNASADFLNDVKALPEGAIILSAVKDEASKRLSAKAKKFFEKMGSQQVDALGFRHSWAFIGVKGQEAYTEEISGTEAIGTGAILGYAKKVKHYKKETKISGGSKIEVHSAGYKHGNYARVLVNEKEVFTNKEAGRGINIFALDFETHKGIFKGKYDTFGNGNASGNLLKDFKDKLPQFCIVVASVKDEASTKLSKEVKGLFTELGSKTIKNLKFR
jgi:hypothetical protein